MSIKRLLNDELPKEGRSTPLEKSEADHAIKVLRLRDGDKVHVLNGKGQAVVATIRLKGKTSTLEFISNLALPKGTVPIILELAVLKGQAMEWAIEKAAELGVEKIVPILTQTTVVQMGKKGPEEFQTRWQKIADQALKQCGRAERMEIATPTTFETRLRDEAGTIHSPRLWFDEALAQEKSLELVQWCNSRTSPPKSLKLLIGSEGGWDPKERDLLNRSPNTERLSLGPLVLRAETAAINSASLASAFLRTWNT
jgi:16S rRNA (uracil1498-N3)-methyltransferase